MKNQTPLTRSINPNRNSLNRSSRHGGTTAGFLTAFALACSPLSPQALAVCQEGCLANENTVLGNDTLLFNTGFDNTATGFDALFSNTTGLDNTANGVAALKDNTTGYSNTATGVDALFSNSTGSSNTANGFAALYFNNGDANTATGAGALFSNTTGIKNTAYGASALGSNISGIYNTAVGFNALYSNNGSANTAAGVDALYSNTTGSYNTAYGYAALYGLTIGINNTATGLDALFNDSTGSSNTANGAAALYFNTTGNDNIADGFQALENNTTGSSNIALGSNAGFNLTTGSNNIDIGNKGKAGESDYIRIGTKGTHTHTLIAGISGATVARGVGVIIDSNGHLGTVVSSERFKEAVQPMDKASEAILALKPVTFRYKHEVDPDGIPQFGLVAEEVERVNPDLVARDEQGKPYTVRYDAVNAMLLNEFLKQHRKVEEQSREINEQKTTITQLQSTITEQQESFDSSLAEQEQQIRALASGLQKVSAQIEMSRPAPKVVASQP